MIRAAQGGDKKLNDGVQVAQGEHGVVELAVLLHVSSTPRTRTRISSSVCGFWARARRLDTIRQHQDGRLRDRGRGPG